MRCQMRWSDGDAMQDAMERWRDGMMEPRYSDAVVRMRMTKLYENET